jgi:hypothetical protein
LSRLSINSVGVDEETLTSKLGIDAENANESEPPHVHPPPYCYGGRVGSYNIQVLALFHLAEASDGFLGDGGNDATFVAVAQGKRHEDEARAIG